MHRAGMGQEGGKGFGRGGYRSYRPADRGSYLDNNSSSSAEAFGSQGVHGSKPGRAGDDTLMAPQSAITELEKRLDGVKADFSQQLEKIGGKETEKFDLIFAILTELQSRQASLEESVRS